MLYFKWVSPLHTCYIPASKNLKGKELFLPFSTIFQEKTNDSNSYIKVIHERRHWGFGRGGGQGRGGNLYICWIEKEFHGPSWLTPFSWALSGLQRKPLPPFGISVEDRFWTELKVNCAKGLWCVDKSGATLNRARAGILGNCPSRLTPQTFQKFDEAK